MTDLTIMDASTRLNRAAKTLAGTDCGFFSLLPADMTIVVEREWEAACVLTVCLRDLTQPPMTDETLLSQHEADKREIERLEAGRDWIGERWRFWGQMHRADEPGSIAAHRSEAWVLALGMAYQQLGGDLQALTPKESGDE